MRGIGWETALQAVIARLDASAKALDATVQTVQDLQVVLVKQAMTILELMDYRDELEKELDELRRRAS